MMAFKRRKKVQEEDLSLTALLGSENNEEILEGLKMLREQPDHEHVSQTMELIHHRDLKIAEEAKDVCVLLSEKCVSDRDRQIGRLRLLNAVLVIKRYHPEFIEATLEDLDSPHSEVVIDSLHSLKHFLNEKQALEMVDRFLGHHDEKVRATVCTQIGMATTKNSITLFSKFLDDKDTRVRANVIELIEQMSDYKSVPLLQKYRYDTNNRIRGNAIKALHTLGEGALEEDLRIMLTHDLPLMRASATWVIGEISHSDKKYLKLLNFVAEDNEEIVERNVLRVVNRFGKIKQLKLVTKTLEKRGLELKDLRPPKAVKEAKS